MGKHRGNALRKVGLQNVEELVVELSARTAVGYVQQLANSYLSTKTSASTIINSCNSMFLGSMINQQSFSVIFLSSHTVHVVHEQVPVRINTTWKHV